RLLCAAPAYIAARGNPADGAALVKDSHACLVLRFPGTKEFQWTLQTSAGPQSYPVSGPFESDDGDVLTEWALAGHGIVLKPYFEVATHLKAGRLVPVATATPPLATQLSCLTPHRRMKDTKVDLFTDFMVPRIRASLSVA
ncbi:MAG TPA: LysR family transcriptional regulator, partial [Aliiroseovarius sp.]|nr:LysR family transcriptional regulator [Aliiroseovarius sp.]